MTAADGAAGLLRLVNVWLFAIAAKFGNIIGKTPAAGRTGGKHCGYPKVDSFLRELL